MHLKEYQHIYGSDYMILEKTSAGEGGFGRTTQFWNGFLSDCLIFVEGFADSTFNSCQQPKAFGFFILKQ